MKYFLSTLFLVSFFFAFNVLAQTTLPTTIPTDEETIRLAMAAVGGEQTVGILGLVLLVVQGVMLACRGWLGDCLGKFKLLVVTGLTVGITVLAMKLHGATWMQAGMCSATLSALQVFLHQIIKQFVTKEQ